MTTGDDGTLAVATDGDILAAGSYVLVETGVPEGYVLDGEPIRIVVDDEGVHVDAGTADDNVTVETGIGGLVYSMKGFAAEDHVDATLHDVQAQPQTASSYDGASTQWGSATDEDGQTLSALHFQYNDTSDTDLTYVPTSGVTAEATYTAQAGWSRLDVTQCREHAASGTYKQDLTGYSLNGLFTGDVVIHVTNDRLGTVEVSKTVEGVGAPADQSFEYTVELFEADGTTPLDGSFTAQVYGADGQPAGTSFKIANEPSADAQNTFSLKDGEHIAIAGLPEGARVVVTETAAEGFAAQVDVAVAGVAVQGEDVAEDDAAAGSEDGAAVGTAAEAVAGTAAEAMADTGFEVSDDGLTASVTVSNNGTVTIAYTNTYTTLDAEHALAVTKNLTGHDLSGTEGDIANFSFTVTPVDTVTTDEATGEQQVTTTASEAGAKIGLSADEQGNVGSLAFSNGDAAQQDTDGDQVPDTATDTMNPITGGMTFTAADEGKAFTYEVSEVLPADATDNGDGTYSRNGVTYDASLAHRVTYTVQRSDSGELAVEVAVDGQVVVAGADGAAGVPTVVFANSYTAQAGQFDPASIEGGIVKEVAVAGSDELADPAGYTFELSVRNVTGDGVAENDGFALPDPAVAASDADGSVAFGPVTFTQVGIYEVAVKEQLPADDDAETPGVQSGDVTYDEHSLTYTVQVSDNGEGSLEASVVEGTVGDGEGVFVNTLTPTGSLTVSKTVEVPEGQQSTPDPDQLFTFTVHLTDASGAALTGTYAFAGTSDGTAAYTGTVGDGDTITLADGGSVTIDGLPEGTVYTVEEDPVVGYTTTATGDSGTIAADVPATAAFVNSYTSATGGLGGAGQTSIEASKTLTGRPQAAGEFDFTVTDATGAVVAHGTNAAAGDGEASQVVFDVITYTTESLAADAAKGIDGLADHTVVDGKDTYTYEYTVAEDTTGFADKGLAGVATSFDIVVTVVDNGDATLTISVDYPGDAASLAFENSYAEGAAAEVTLEGAHKTFENAELADGRFSFVVADASDPTHVVAGGQNDAEGNISFGSWSYGTDDLIDVTPDDKGVRTKQFYYTVSEVNGGDLIGGVQYSDAVYTVEVTLTDDGVGHLTAAVTRVQNAAGEDVGQGGVAFDNVYTESDVTTAQLQAVKVLTGRDMAEGERYSVAAYAYDPATGTVAATPSASGETTYAGTNGQEVPVLLSTLRYDAASLAEGSSPVLDAEGNPTGASYKTFVYQMVEANGGTTVDNVAYSDAVYYAAVTVTDDGRGNLDAQVAYYDDAALTVPLEGVPTFENVYTPSDTTYPISGFKTTEAAQGVSVPDGLTFSYDITDVTDPSAPVHVGTATSPANGSLSGSVEVTSTGTFTYRISEVNGGQTVGGIAYDGTVYYLVLSVSTDPSTGAYQISAQYYRDAVAAGNEVEPGAASFANVYGSEVGASIDLGASKQLEGASFDEVAPFDFTVTEVTDPGNPQVVARGTNNGGTVDFGSITYELKVEDAAGQGDQADAGEDGTSDEATDDAAAAAGETGEDATGTEGAPDVGASGEGDPAAGGDTAEMGDSAGQGGVAGDGQAGDAATGGDSVDAGIAADGGTTDVAGSAGTDSQPGTAGDAGTGSAQEGESSDAGTDVAGAADEDAAQGGDAASAAAVADEAEATSDEGLSLASVFGAAEAVADDAGAEQYTVDGTAAGTPEVAEVTEAGESTGAAEPTVVSSDIGTHVYLITENIPEGATYNEQTGTYTYRGVTYDSSSYRVTVEVSASYDAASNAVTMQAVVTGIDHVFADGSAVPVTVPADDPCANVVFANSYAASEPATVTLEGTKTLTGRDMAEGETFGFSVYLGDKLVATGTSRAAGNGEQAAIEFTPLTIEEPGTYTYRVVENNGGTTEAGVTYDGNSFEVTVTVSDNHDGTLVAEVSYPEGGIAFENTYRTAGSAAVTLEGTKTLTGRYMAEGEFTFTVTETVDGSSKVVSTGRSAAAADGEKAQITFSPIEYDEVGEHDYVVSESGAGTTEAGVTHDGRSLRVHVSVTDNGQGGLVATASYLDGALDFANSYGTSSDAKATVTPTATKTLTGRAMAESEFTFTVTETVDGVSTVVSTGTNAADGTVAFEPIEYTEPGSHEYVIAEVNGRQDGMTYDDATYRLQVTVADDGKGGLTTEVSYPDGTPAFANSYEDPGEGGNEGGNGDDGGDNGGGTQGGDGGSDIPKTGDATSATAAACLAGAGMVLAAGAGALALRRRADR